MEGFAIIPLNFSEYGTLKAAVRSYDVSVKTDTVTAVDYRPCQIDDFSFDPKVPARQFNPGASSKWRVFVEAFASNMMCT